MTMILLRNVASSLALNFLLFALMAMTVQTPLSIIIPSKPIEFSWIEKKVEEVKSEPKIEKPVYIPKPVAKKIVRPAPPEPIVIKEKKPEPALIEPPPKETKPPEIKKPAPAKIPRETASINKPKDTKTYFELNKLSVPPGFVSRPIPKYPTLARRAGREGEVVLEIWLEPDGSISKIEIVKSAGWGFDKAALKAAHSSRFTPGQIEGQPVRSRVRAPYIFRLK